MRSTPLVLLVIAVLCGLGVGVGCDSNDGVETVLPPLKVRSTFPVDQTNLNGVGLDSMTLSLSVVFIRNSGPGDVYLRVFPTPLDAGPITLTSTGRGWTWNDVKLSAARGAYYWLIDGSEVPIPKVVRLITGFALVSAGFQGTIRSTNPATLPVDGTLVFALPVSENFNPLDPAAFDLSRAVAVAGVDSLGKVGERDYHMSYMLVDSLVNAVAILDTNNDAHYDLVHDAWGYMAQTGDLSPEPIYVDLLPIFGGPNNYRLDIDITIAPPAVMRQRLRAASGGQ